MGFAIYFKSKILTTETLSCRWGLRKIRPEISTNRNPKIDETHQLGFRQYFNKYVSLFSIFFRN
jgi:hypothetical protein